MGEIGLRTVVVLGMVFISFISPGNDHTVWDREKKRKKHRKKQREPTERHRIQPEEKRIEGNDTRKESGDGMAAVKERTNE